MLLLRIWEPGGPVFWPMCGTGTFQRGELPFLILAKASLQTSETLPASLPSSRRFHVLRAKQFGRYQRSFRRDGARLATSPRNRTQEASRHLLHSGAEPCTGFFEKPLRIGPRKSTVRDSSQTCHRNSQSKSQDQTKSKDANQPFHDPPHLGTTSARYPDSVANQAILQL
jgi:hypothetical protein